MLKLKKAETKFLSEIQEASGGEIEFRIVGESVVSIKFPTPKGTLFVEVGSYNVTVNFAATKKVWKLGFFKQVADEKIFIEKEFGSEQERESFISHYLFDDNREELSLSEEEVVDQ